MNKRYNRSAWAVGGLIVAAALAGCIGNDGLDRDTQDDGPQGEGGEDRSRWSDDLFGWVVDPSFGPVAGVNMSVVGAIGETTTNTTGFYSLDELPRGEELIVIAQDERFLTQSKRLVLPTQGSMRLNFTLEARPVLTPWHEVLEFNGLLACQLVAEYEEGHMSAQVTPRDAASWGAGAPAGSTQQQSGQKTKVDCGFADPNNADQWEFSVGPDLAGVVVEVSWDAQTTLAENFRVKLEVTGHGGDDATLAEVVGPSVLRARVNNHQAEQFYQDGGFIRVSVEVDPNVDDEEAGTGVAFAYQEEFTIHATAFYQQAPPATYSFHDA